MYETDIEPNGYVVAVGVAQDSILGLLLWNIMNDEGNIGLVCR